MANWKTKFRDLIKPVSMFCAVSDFGADFTIQAMFETPRTMVILVVRLRGSMILIEFEEDTIGLQRLAGTFDVRRISDAFAYVERHIEELRSGTHVTAADMNILLRATA